MSKWACLMQMGLFDANGMVMSIKKDCKMMENVV